VEKYESIETFVKLYQYEHAIEIVPSQVHFYAGLPFSIAVTVKSHDGTSIMGAYSKVGIAIYYDFGRTALFSTEYELDNHGMVQFFHTVPQNVATISIIVSIVFFFSDFHLLWKLRIQDALHHKILMPILSLIYFLDLIRPNT
jgi:hypothetical protein